MPIGNNILVFHLFIYLFIFYSVHFFANGKSLTEISVRICLLIFIGNLGDRCEIAINAFNDAMLFSYQCVIGSNRMVRIRTNLTVLPLPLLKTHVISF